MLNLAVFVSGRGSNLKAIHQAIVERRLDARLALVVASSPRSQALDWAEAEQISTHVFPDNSPESLSALQEAMDLTAVDFVALAGYLRQIPPELVHRFSGRMTNIHPALLPCFGGKGMYGRHVHEAVISSGVKVSGVTVHLVDKDYDKGPIVMQKTVDVHDGDSPEDLARRVLHVEHEIYAAALQLFAKHRIRVEGRRTIILR